MADRDKQQDFLNYLDVKDEFDAKMAKIDEIERFDVLFGVETSTPFETWDVDEMDEIGLRNNYRYSPSPARTLREVLSAVPLVHDEATFIDFGSGKGRVLLLASEFPFKRIIGVEYSERLCKIAAQNLASYRSDSQKCHEIQIHHQDAAEFAIPDGACVFYFYEPFSSEVAERVLANIERSINCTPGSRKGR